MAKKKKKNVAEEGIAFSPAETAWNCFKGTGLLSYYLLYKKLDNKLDDK
jgi:hypothetical protein